MRPHIHIPTGETTTIRDAVAAEITRLTPTAKQLRYLSYLAKKQRSSYAIPVTRQQAHAEIERLLKEPKARARRRKMRKAKTPSRGSS